MPTIRSCILASAIGRWKTQQPNKGGRNYPFASRASMSRKTNRAEERRQVQLGRHHREGRVFRLSDQTSSRSYPWVLPNPRGPIRTNAALAVLKPVRAPATGACRPPDRAYQRMALAVCAQRRIELHCVAPVHTGVAYEDVVDLAIHGGMPTYRSLEPPKRTDTASATSPTFWSRRE